MPRHRSAPETAESAISASVNLRSCSSSLLHIPHASESRISLPVTHRKGYEDTAIECSEIDESVPRLCESGPNNLGRRQHGLFSQSRVCNANHGMHANLFLRGSANVKRMEGSFWPQKAQS